MFAPRIKHILATAEIGSTISISGWVQKKQKRSGFSFVDLNDGSSIEGLQIIIDNDVEDYENFARLSRVGASVTVEGTIMESQGRQRIELHAKKVQVIGEVADDYPIQAKRQTPEFLREKAHLRARTKILGATMRVRSVAAQAIHSFFQKYDFSYIHTPIITASDCEGAGEMFQVSTLDMENPPKLENGSIDYSQDFFARKAFLTVSGQLNAENMACALGRVYTFGPTFRAENSNTTRHVSEFWMIEPEMAFADLNTNIDLATLFLQEVIGEVLERSAEDIAFFDKVRTFKTPFVENTKTSLLESLRSVVETPFERMTYTEAVTQVQKAKKKKFQYPIRWGEALQTEHERYISEELLKAPVVITDYPEECKAFYMYRNDDQKTVRAMDVIVPRIGEIIGGSQREDRHDILRDRIIHHGLDPKDYWWYLDLRKYGSVPHSGFGLGFSRLVMYLTGMNNIRDVLPFPRTPKHADF
jgi:asparaginyl-tRNA synthetase